MRCRQNHSASWRQHRATGRAVRGVARDLDRWRTEVPDFAAALRRGCVWADAQVARNLYELGVGYAHMVERVMKGPDGPVRVTYMKHYPPQTRACMEWLENRCPEHWGRAAARRKLQAWEDARDDRARRPAIVPSASVAALVAARAEAERTVEPPPAADPVPAAAWPPLDDPYGAAMGVCRAVVERVALQGVLGWFGAAPLRDDGKDLAADLAREGWHASCSASIRRSVDTLAPETTTAQACAPPVKLIALS